jgi:hypothetical protein
VNRSRGGGVEPAEAFVCGARVIVVHLSPALARPRLGRRRELELGERRPKVETSPADHDRRPAVREDFIDRRMGERRVGPNGRLRSSDQIPTSLVGEPVWFVRIDSPRYTCMASAETSSEDAPPRASATLDLPLAVGPNMPITVTSAFSLALHLGEVVRIRS